MRISDWSSDVCSSDLDGAATDPQQVAAQLGQPQGMTLVLISVLATASAALVLYFWRRPASAVERTVSHAAARRPSTWAWAALAGVAAFRSEEHTSELQSLMRISYAVFCLKKKSKRYKSK